MRRIMLLLAAALVALVAAGASSAQRAVHLSNAIDLNESFEAEDLSEQCGFPVTITFSGEARRDVDLPRGGPRRSGDRHGARSEDDVQLAVWLVQLPVRPDLDLHVSRRRNARRNGEHHVFGSLSHVTGILPSDAGIDIIGDAVVIGFTPEGIPDVAFTEETTFISHANRESEENVVSAICSALSPA
jgi:hypothetical protein